MASFSQAASLESSICRLHCKDDAAHYMEAFEATPLPCVRVQVKSFAAKVHTLLQVRDTLDHTQNPVPYPKSYPTPASSRLHQQSKIPQLSRGPMSRNVAVTVCPKVKRSSSSRCTKSNTPV